MIAEGTVKHYVVSILAKLGAQDRTHAVSLAIGRNIIDVDDLDLQSAKPPKR